MQALSALLPRQADPGQPFELDTLARSLGITSQQFRERFTEEGRGTHLERRADATCVFLGPEGCTVHDARPLVCRLFPLGRHITAAGSETFTHMEPAPASRGVYGHDKTIADLLREQDRGCGRVFLVAIPRRLPAGGRSDSTGSQRSDRSGDSRPRDGHRTALSGASPACARRAQGATVVTPSGSRRSAVET